MTILQRSSRNFPTCSRTSSSCFWFWAGIQNFRTSCPSTQSVGGWCRGAVGCICFRTASYALYPVGSTILTIDSVFLRTEALHPQLLIFFDSAVERVRVPNYIKLFGRGPAPSISVVGESRLGHI